MLFIRQRAGVVAEVLRRLDLRAAAAGARNRATRPRVVDGCARRLRVGARARASG